MLFLNAFILLLLLYYYYYKMVKNNFHIYFLEELRKKGHEWGEKIELF
jgi:hypothetical protein